LKQNSWKIERENFLENLDTVMFENSIKKNELEIKDISSISIFNFYKDDSFNSLDYHCLDF